MCLFQLLLGAELIGVSTLLLTAVLGTRGKTGIALSANGLVTVESLGQEGQSGVVDTSSQSEHQVQGGFLLDVVVTEGASVF